MTRCWWCFQGPKGELSAAEGLWQTLAVQLTDGLCARHVVVILKIPGNKPPITLIRRSGWYNSTIHPVHAVPPHPHCAQIWILFTSTLCGGPRTVLVLCWQNPPLSLSLFLTHSVFSVSLCLYFCILARHCFYVGAGCSCTDQKAASQEVWGEKNLFFIRNKQQGHIMTCDKGSQKCWQAYNILERQLNHLTSTRGCLTCVLLLSVPQGHMGLNPAHTSVVFLKEFSALDS